MFIFLIVLSSYVVVVFSLTCDGILSNDTNVCSGHGFCARDDICTCSVLYEGNNCKNWIPRYWKMPTGDGYGDHASSGKITSYDPSNLISGRSDSCFVKINECEAIIMYGGGASGYLADIWMYSFCEENFKFVREETGRSNLGVQGEYSSAGYPGVRNQMTCFLLEEDVILMYGGLGSTTSADECRLDEVWYYNITSSEWMFKWGNDACTNNPVYDTLYEYNDNNRVGGLSPASGFPYPDRGLGDMVVFGGVDSANGYHNQIFFFKGNLSANGQFRWESGSGTDQMGSLVDKGSFSTGYPGSRRIAAVAAFSNGDIFIFGGLGCSGVSTSLNMLNDAFIYRPSLKQWKWVSGSTAHLGTVSVFQELKNHYHSSNTPSAQRNVIIGYFAQTDELIIYGGTSSTNSLNGLWFFSHSTDQWMLVSGSHSDVTPLEFGTTGRKIYNHDNHPGSSISLQNIPVFGGESDVDDYSLMLIGGRGYDIDFDVGTNFLSDVWVYGTNRKEESCQNTTTTTTNVTFANYTSFYILYNDSRVDNFKNGEPTSDGGYISCGYTHLPTLDLLIVKVDENMEVEWAKTVDLGGNDQFLSCFEVSDGYVAAGYDNSSVSGGIVGKFSLSGDVDWIVGFELTFIMSIFETCDGDFVAVGNDFFYDLSNGEAFILKLNSSGEVMWFRTLGGAGTGLERFDRVVQSNDGGYYTCGRTATYGAGQQDAIVAKFDYLGSIIWIKTLGMSKNDYLYDIVELDDGNIVVVGSSTSGSDYNATIVKIDPFGELVWSFTLGGNDFENFNCISVSTDGSELILGGSTTSFSVGIEDMMIAKIDSTDGSLIWVKTKGGSGIELALSIHESSDGSIIIGGQSQHTFGETEILLLSKLDENGDGCGFVDRTDSFSYQEWSGVVINDTILTDPRFDQRSLPLVSNHSLDPIVTDFVFYLNVLKDCVELRNASQSEIPAVSEHSYFLYKSGSIEGNGGVGGNYSDCYSQFSSPGGRSRMGGSVFGSAGGSMLYVFGGYGYGEVDGVKGNLGDLWKYDLKSGLWCYLKGPKSVNSPENQFGLSSPYEFDENHFPGCRSSFSTFSTLFSLFVFGGDRSSFGYYDLFISTTNSTNELWELSIVHPSVQWRKLSDENQLLQQQQQPSTRSSGCAAMKFGNSLSQSQYVYIFGGGSFDLESRTSILVGDFWRYNLFDNTYTLLRNSSSEVVGGTNNNITKLYESSFVFKEFNDSESYNPPNRYRHVCWVGGSDEHFYVFGGSLSSSSSLASGSMNDVWMFNTTRNSWAWIFGSFDRNVNQVSGGNKFGYDTLNEPAGRSSPMIFSKSEDPKFALANSVDILFFGGINVANDVVFSDVWGFSNTLQLFKFVNGSETGNQKQDSGDLTKIGGRFSGLALRDANTFYIFGGER